MVLDLELYLEKGPKFGLTFAWFSLKEVSQGLRTALKVYEFGEKVLENWQRSVEDLQLGE